MYKRISKKIGIPLDVMRRGIWNLEHKAKGILRPNGLYLYRMEKRMEKSVHGLLLKQMDYVLRHTAELSFFKEKGIRIVTKALDNEINDMLYNLPHRKDIAQTMRSYTGIVMLKGANTRIQKMKLGQFGITFNLTNHRAIQYLDGLTTLHLSERNGSINKTTKEGILKVISNGIRDGNSYNEIAKRIQSLSDEGIFSPARAQLIATNTLAKGYEFGNKAPMQEVKDRGMRVQKSWITVGDDKVTPECAANEAQGWLDFDEKHASGDSEPPRSGNPRCRCSEGYQIFDETGKEAENPDSIQPPEQDSKPTTTKNTIELSDGTLVKSPTGFGYHATPQGNIASIAETGLEPRISTLDQNDKGGDARVYFGVDKSIAGSGLLMEKEGVSYLRVPLDEIGKAHLDPHIPKAGSYALSFYTDHGHDPSVIQIEDENGKWISISKYIKDH